MLDLAGGFLQPLDDREEAPDEPETIQTLHVSEKNVTKIKLTKNRTASD